METNFEIFGDGRTVWVNGPDGGCWARFGLSGIDIHKTVDAQVRTGLECIYCVQGRLNEVGWQLFRQKVLEIHGAVIPERLRPAWVGKEST